VSQRDQAHLDGCSAALREPDQRLHWALEAAGGGAWDWDLKGGEAWWSPEMYALWGVPPGTRMLLDNSLEPVLEQDRARVQAAVETAIARRTDYRCELRIRHPERGERWMVSQGRLVFDPGGEPVRLSGLTFDITERKQAEAAQRLSEDRLRQALDAAAMVTFDWDIQRDTVDQSASTAPVFAMFQDWPANALDELRALVHPQDRERFDANVAAALESADGRYVNEFRIVQADGRIFWLSESGRVERDAQGRPARLIGLSQDITARRQVEENLRQTNERLRLLLDALPIGVVIAEDAQCLVQTSNAAGARLFETAPQTNISASGAAPPAHRYFQQGRELEPEELPMQLAVLGDRVVADMELEVHLAGGRRWSALVTAAPLHGPGGEVVGGILIVQDIGERKAALREQEKLLQLIEASADFIAMADLDGRVTYMNPGARRLIGLDAEAEVGSLHFTDYVPESWQAFFRDTMLPTLHRQGYWEGEMQLRNLKTGALPDVSRHSFLVRDPQTGDPWCYGTVTRDMTALKRTAEALRLSEEKLRLAQRVAEIGTFDVDLKTGLDTWTPELEAMYGLPPGGFAGTQGAWFDLIHPEDRAAVLGLVEQSFQTAAPTAGEWRVRWPDGSEHWIAGRWRTLTDAADRPVRMIGVNFDVTERKRVEDDLRQSEMRYRMLHENLRDAFVQVAMDGHILECNELYCRMLGYTSAELRRLTYRDLTPARWHRFEEGIVREQILPRGYSEVYEKEYVRRDGTPVPVELRTILARDAAGRPVSMWAIVRDIAARKESEAALREADRRKDAFIAILAHELRNPLVPIRNAVAILNLAGSPNPTEQTARDMIDRQVRHLVRLVDDLLDVGRINRGVLQLRREPVALAALVGQVLESARPQIEQAGHRLTAALPDAPILLDADPVRLAQVFHNLLDNACKYSERGGTIRFCAERVGAQVMVRIADRGIGIAPEDLPRLFELFVQAGRACGQAPAGLGIGLALCRELVELHGGTIEAHSAGPGQGSEFCVLLPALSAVPEAQADAPAARPSGPADPVRVLVVDDNVDSAESLAFLLRESGYAVTTAHDGLAGVAAAGRERPQIVLLDLGMPKLDGYGACRRIREQPWGQAMRIIALTGWGQADDRRPTQEAGFDLHLVKPIELSVLLRLLADAEAGKTAAPT
jgi:PAS domain S-box-containing protein